MQLFHNYSYYYSLILSTILSFITFLPTSSFEDKICEGKDTEKLQNDNNKRPKTSKEY